MLTPSKKQKLLNALRAYKKKYLDIGINELDESGTRLLINSFLSDVLGYKPIEEIKTEYMIKGTYADYVIQVNNVRYFLVEVKALSFDLSDKHLRQTINYGANEGIEYALLTNGRNFEFYKILFEKPIEARKIFEIDISDGSTIKSSAEYFQYLHKDSTVKHLFKPLWNKCEAVHPLNLAGMLISDQIINQIKKMIKLKYGEKCNDMDIIKSVQTIITDKINIELIRPFKTAKHKNIRRRKVELPGPALSEISVQANQEDIGIN
jgi:hypothetical protein